MFAQVSLAPLLVSRGNSLLMDKGIVIEMMIPKAVYILRVKISISRWVDWV